MTTPTGLPPEAVTAAEQALIHHYRRDEHDNNWDWTALRRDATAALEAAAPHLAAAERERCAQLAEQEAATLAASEGTGHRALRRFANLLREQP